MFAQINGVLPIFDLLLRENVQFISMHKIVAVWLMAFDMYEQI